MNSCPGVVPQPHDRAVAGTPLLGELVERCPGRAGVDRGVDGFDVAAQRVPGQDCYVSFGEESGIRSWDDARRHGFVSAGGSESFSRSLHAPPIGGRVFVYIPRVGYVAVGTVTGEASPFDNAVVGVGDDQRKMTDLDLVAERRHADDGPDQDEYAPVKWIKVLGRPDAIREKSPFANQHPACKLRNKFTLETLTRRFGSTSSTVDLGGRPARRHAA